MTNKKLKKICGNLRNLRIKTLCFILFMVNISAIYAEPAKIAIIGDTEKYQKEVDLLTVQLSQDENIHLLERSDWDYLLREHEISQSNIAQKSIQFGRLLGADGLIILSEETIKDKKYLTSKLLAVKTGIILDSLVSPIDKNNEVATLTDSIKYRFQPKFNKLHKSQDNIVTVSMLNLRSVLSTPELLTFEREINTIFAHRLMQEENILVAERWNMAEASFEKHVSGEDESGFKTGTNIIEGSITQKDDNIEIKLLVRSPDGEKQEIIVTDKKENLAQIADKLTTEFLKVAQVAKKTIHYDRAKEANEYFKEAQWAFNAGLFQKAAQSAESAWALGCRTNEMISLRISCFMNATYPTVYNENLSKYKEYRAGFITVAESDKYVNSGIFALELYKKYVYNKNISKKQEFSYYKQDWQKLGIEIIDHTRRMLRCYYEENSLDKHRDKTAYLRKEIRTFIEPLELRTEHEYLEYLPLIFDSWEDIKKEYVLCLGEKFYKKNKEMFMGTRWNMGQHFSENNSKNKTIPLYINWKENKIVSEEQKKEFLNELKISDNLQLQFDALSFEIECEGFENRDKPLESYMDFIEKHIEELAQQKIFISHNFHLYFDEKYNTILSKVLKEMLKYAITNKKQIENKGVGFISIIDDFYKTNDMKLKEFMELMKRCKETVTPENLKEFKATEFTATDAERKEMFLLLKEHQELKTSKYSVYFLGRLYDVLKKEFEIKEKSQLEFVEYIKGDVNSELQDYKLQKIDCKDGKVYFLFQKYINETEAYYAISIVDLDTKEREIFKSEKIDYFVCNQLLEFGREDPLDRGRIHLVMNKNYIIFGKDEFIQLNLNSKEWSKVKLPKKKYSAISLDNKFLYAGFSDDFETGLLSYEIELEKMNLLASTRMKKYLPLTMMLSFNSKLPDLYSIENISEDYLLVVLGTYSPDIYCLFDKNKKELIVPQSIDDKLIKRFVKRCVVGEAAFGELRRCLLVVHNELENRYLHIPISDRENVIIDKCKKLSIPMKHYDSKSFPFYLGEYFNNKTADNFITWDYDYKKKHYMFTLFEADKFYTKQIPFELDEDITDILHLRDDNTYLQITKEHILLKAKGKVAIYAVELDKVKKIAEKILLPFKVNIEHPYFEERTPFKFEGNNLNDIYFTIDDTEPTLKSAKYAETESYYISKSCNLKAKRIKKGYKSSETITNKLHKIDKELKQGLIYAYAEVKRGAYPSLKKKKYEKVVNCNFTLENLIDRDEYFCLNLNGYIKIEKTGKYKFYLNSGKGARLLIDKKLNIKSWGNPKNDIIERMLYKGFHKIELHYPHKTGKPALKLEYSGPGIEKQEIPALALFSS